MNPAVTVKSAKIAAEIIIMTINERIDELKGIIEILSTADTDKARIVGIYKYLEYIAKELPQVAELVNEGKKAFGKATQKEYSILVNNIAGFFAELKEFNSKILKNEHVANVVKEFSNIKVRDITRKDIEFEHYIGLYGKSAIKLTELGYSLSESKITDKESKQIFTFKHKLNKHKIQEFIDKMRLCRETSVWNAYEKLEKFHEIASNLPTERYTKNSMIKEEFNELLLGIECELKYLKIADYKQYLVDLHKFILKNQGRLPEAYPQLIPVNSGLQPPTAWKLMEDEHFLILEYKGENVLKLVKRGCRWKTFKLLWQRHGKLVTYLEIYENEYDTGYPKHKTNVINRNTRTKIYQLTAKIPLPYKDKVIINVANGITLKLT